MADEAANQPWGDWRRQIDVLQSMLLERGYTGLRVEMCGYDPLLAARCINLRREPTMAFFSREAQLSVKMLRKMRAEARENECRHLIVVTAEGLTPFAARELAETVGEDVVEVFKKRELAFAVTRHVRVPRHHVLSQREKEELLRRLACDDAALPKLSPQDPVAKFLQLVPGQVVRVIRTFGTLEPEVYYRVVG